jgi:hypothetical protein
VWFDPEVLFEVAEGTLGGRADNKANSWTTR